MSDDPQFRCKDGKLQVFVPNAGNEDPVYEGEVWDMGLLTEIRDALLGIRDDTTLQSSRYTFYKLTVDANTTDQGITLAFPARKLILTSSKPTKIRLNEVNNSQIEIRGIDYPLETPIFPLRHAVTRIYVTTTDAAELRLLYFG